MVTGTWSACASFFSVSRDELRLRGALECREVPLADMRLRGQLDLHQLPGLPESSHHRPQRSGRHYSLAELGGRER